MSEILTQKLLFPDVKIKETHILNIPPCCPISHNPLEGSTVTISYFPVDFSLEVKSLHAYIESYVGGKHPVRGMEDMIRKIAIDCHKILKLPVNVKADLLLQPTQQMIIEISI